MTGAYQFLKKYGVAIGFGTGTILSVLTWTIIVAGYPELNPTNEELYDMGIFDFGLYTTYALVIIACAVVVIFSGLYVAKNPKESVKGLIGLAVILVLFFVTYSMGDGALTGDLVNSDPTLLPVEAKQINGQTIMVPVVLEEGKTYSQGLQFADGIVKFGYIMMLLAVITMLGAIGRDFVKQS